MALNDKKSIKNLSTEFIEANNISIKKHIRSTKINIDMPENFDIFNNTEFVINFIINNLKQLTRIKKNNTMIVIDHRNEKISSLGSEYLIGLLIKDYIHHFKRNQGVYILGKKPSEQDQSYILNLIQHIGLEKEINEEYDANDTFENQKGSFFRFDFNRHYFFQNKQYKKENAIRKTVAFLENYLNENTNSSLDPRYKDQIKSCLGEVLDNIEEHCNRENPIWYIRSFFSKENGFELSIFNIGDSFFESIEKLSDESNIKKVIMGYVNLHKSTIDKESLSTVACLQGSISSKSDIDGTRGQGTVTLIESIEKIYNIHKRYNNYSPPQTNIITGRTIIKFDGILSKKTIDNDNAEKFTIAFNEHQNLQFPPNNNNVITMENAVIPGVMINIRFPVQ